MVWTAVVQGFVCLEESVEIITARGVDVEGEPLKAVPRMSNGDRENGAKCVELAEHTYGVPCVGMGERAVSIGSALGVMVGGPRRSWSDLRDAGLLGVRALGSCWV